MAFLISKTDIKEYRPTADLPNERIDVYIEEVQKSEMRYLLGEPLYYDFITKYSDSGDPMYNNYQNLLNGTTYTYNSETIEFFGLKPMLVYYTLARFVVQNPVNLTRYGVVQKTNNNSQPLEVSQIRMVETSLKGEAVRYQNDAEKYLLENNTTYPLYNKRLSKPVNSSSFKFFGV